MNICMDCKRPIPDDDLIKASLDAYADEDDYDLICPYCGGNQVIDVYED